MVHAFTETDVRGRFLIYPKTTLGEVKRGIWETMLEDSEKKKIGSLDNFVLKINGATPIRSQQHKWEAIEFFDKKDYLLAVPLN